MSIPVQLITDLNAALSVPVVVGGADVPISAKDHSKKLVDLLRQVLPGEVYANSTKEKRNYPDCVYKIGSSTVLDTLGIATGRESGFVCFLHDKRHENASIKFDEIDVLLNAQSGIEITDTASDYNKETSTHEIGFEVMINTPLSFDDAGGGSVVAIQGDCQSAPNQMDNCLEQDKTCQMHFVIQAKDDATLKIIQAELQEEILGKTLSQYHTPVEHSRSQILASSGGMSSLVESYQSTELISSI